jgi:hypothetical protein
MPNRREKISWVFLHNNPAFLQGEQKPWCLNHVRSLPNQQVIIPHGGPALAIT